MGKRIKKRNGIVRCEVTGRIVNGHPVILAKVNIAKIFLNKMGYAVEETLSKQLGWSVLGIPIMMFMILLLMPQTSGAVLINNPNIPLVSITINNNIGSGGNGSVTNNYYNGSSFNESYALRELNNLRNTSINSDLNPNSTYSNISLGTFQKLFWRGLFRELLGVVNQTSSDGDSSRVIINPSSIMFSNNTIDGEIGQIFQANIIFKENTLGVRSDFQAGNDKPTIWNIWSAGDGRVGLQVDNSGQENYTLIFPHSLGTDGQALLTNNSGTLRWSNISLDTDNVTIRGNLTVNQTITYNGRYGNVVILAAAGIYNVKDTDEGISTAALPLLGKQINLPAANTHRGMFLWIAKNDANANVVNINPNGADTINGVGGVGALVLAAQYQTAHIVSDGVNNWYII